MSGAWTVGRVLEAAAELFARKGIDSARLDAELLLAHALGCDRLRLYLDRDKPLAEPERARFREAVRRRAAREPVAYVTGLRGFWNHEFVVTPGVLVPRPETELLVEKALEFAASIPGYPRLRILELGVGSGALAMTLAGEFPEAEVVGTDASPAALACAEANRARFRLEGRVRLLRGDWFAPLGEERFDLIVSNPPYIPDGEIDALAPEIARHEPREALGGGPDGLRDLRLLLAEAPRRLRPGGRLLLEIGEDQAEKLEAEARASEFLDEVRCFRDYARRPRALSARRRAAQTPSRA